MPKIVVVHLSTSGNTKAMADAIVDGAKLNIFTFKNTTGISINTPT